MTGNITGNADTATALATGRTIGMTGDVVWTSASFDGSGNVTGVAALQANTVSSTELVSAAAESVLYRLAKSEVQHITILNRTEEKADRLIRKFSNMTSINTESNSEAPYDLVINGSSAGLTGEFKPIENILIDECTHFYDLNYSLTQTPFCKWAKEKSEHVDDGIGMLVYQAAHSFEKWFKVFPETAGVIKDLHGMRE